MSDQEFEKKPLEEVSAADAVEEVLSEPISEQEAIEIPTQASAEEAAEPEKQPEAASQPQPAPAPMPYIPVPPAATEKAPKKKFTCPYLGENPELVHRCPHVKNLTVCKILLWVIVGILEIAIIGFAIVGVQSMVRPGEAPSGSMGGGFSQFEDLFPFFGGNGEIGGNGNGGSSSSPFDKEFSGDATENTRTRAQLGLTCYEIDAVRAEYYGVEPGLMISEIQENSAANGKDVQVYDIIVGMDDKKVQNMDDYYEVMEDKEVGDTVTLTLCRPGETKEENKTVKVTITLIKNGDYKENSASSKEENNFPKF